MRVTADLETCQGYANCVVAADDVFDLDEGGKVLMLRDDFSEDERKRVREAVKSCPVSALKLED